MKSRPTQFGMRENTASLRRHASRLAIDSLPSKSAEAIPRSSQHRQPTPVWTYRASESDMSIITMPLEAATGGETADSAEPFPAPTGVIAAKESRRVLLTPEPFVSADEAAQFLCVKRRYLLELARRGIAGAYALGTGSKRKIWVFRLSELAASVVRNETLVPNPSKACTIGTGSPR